MTFSKQHGFKSARLDGDGAVEAGAPLRIWMIGAKGGGADGVVEWHEDEDAADPTAVRGGLSVPAGDWVWSDTIWQQFSQVYFNFDANVAQVIVIYHPATQ
jgi:hypothetical protein